MKTRQGFISNSSSSSFILAVSKEIQSKEDLQKLLFGDKEEVAGIYDNNLSTKRITEIVWKMLKPSVAITSLEELESVIEEEDFIYIEQSGLHGLKWPDINNLANEYEEQLEGKDVWNAINKYLEPLRALLVRLFWCAYKDNSVIYTAEIGDENGEPYVTLEHEGLLDPIPHIRISHH